MIGPEKDIPAPDVGTDEQIMAWMMDTYSVQSGYTVRGVVTGKPVSIGGSRGRAGATSRGVLYTTLCALRDLDLSPHDARVAVQGFGKGGRLAAQFLHDAGCTVVAVSDSKGGAYSGRGLDPVALLRHRRDGRALGVGLPGHRRDHQRGAGRARRGRAGAGRPARRDHRGERRRGSEPV